MTPQTHHQNRLQTADEEIISIREIVGILTNYRWSIIGFTFSAVLITALVVFSITPQYQATSTLQIEQEQKNILSIEDVMGVEGTDSYLNTQHEVLKSRAVMEKAVKKLNLINNPEFNAALREPSALKEYLNWRQWFGIEQPDEVTTPDDEMLAVVSAFRKQVDITPVRKTQIVNVSVQSESPALAAKAANAVSEAYIETWLESKLSLTTSATEWMQARLGDLANELNEANQILQDYKERENLIDLESELSLSQSELTSLTESLAEIRKQLATSESIYLQIKKTGAESVEDLSTLPAVLAHPLIQMLKQDESKVERLVQELSRRYGPKHPKMISANSELNSIQDNIRSQIVQIARGVEREYEVVLANEKALKATVDTSRARVQDISRKQFRLNELERQVKTKRDLYDAFFTRIGETTATADLQTANARIVDTAVVPQKPVSPKKKLIVGIAAIVSLLFAAGCAFLKEMLNNTIRTSRDVEEKLHLPVLGVLPIIEDKTKQEKVYRLFLDSEEHRFGEAVRTIRTGLSLTALDQTHKVFSVTSTEPSEGKSSTAINTALALAQLGKTLLIDADLRRPSVAKVFHLNDQNTGLANILAGYDNIESCIKTRNNLDILPTGTIPPNPQELLASKTFAHFIERVKEDYDYIVLDCPPVQSVSDSLMVAQISDGLMFVVEAGRAPTQAINASIKRLLKAGAPLTGVVLNKVDLSRSSYGYEYEPYGYQGYAAS